MQGKIIKDVGGFYYIHLHDNRIFECKAKGAFRNQNIKPAVGDNVEIDIVEAEYDGHSYLIFGGHGVIHNPKCYGIVWVDVLQL